MRKLCSHLAISVICFAFLANGLSKKSKNGECMITYTERLQGNITFQSCLFNNSLTTSQAECYSLCCTNATMAQNGKIHECLSASPQLLEFKYVLLFCALFISVLIGLVYLLSKVLTYYNHITTHKPIQVDQQNNRVTKSLQNIHWIQNKNATAQIIRQSSLTLDETKHSCTLKNCCVCSKFAANIYSYCGHLFHSHCIYDSAKKYKKCPQCPKHKIFHVKIYCNLCYSHFYVLSLQSFLNLNPPSLECLNCSAKQEAEDKIIKHYWDEDQCTGNGQSQQNNQ